VVQSLIMDKHQLKTSLGKLFQKMDDDQSGLWGAEKSWGPKWETKMNRIQY
jgi:hypothetical protein